MKDAFGNIVLFRADTLTQEIIGFNTTSYNGLTIVADAFDYHLSADKKYLMIAHSYHKLYRYSFFASYVAINIETQELHPIVSPDGIPLVIQTVVWSPVGNGFAYVFTNNIYYRKSVEDNKDYQLTNTGRINSVYTGIPDWVYEEEVLSSSSALWFSPSGNNLAYASFDDNRTVIMTITSKFSSVSKYKYWLSHGATSVPEWASLYGGPSSFQVTERFSVDWNLYGGPSSFQVTERFSVDWNLYLADNKDIVVAYIDGRNSALKGNTLKYAGYRRLGTVEIYDQINVTRTSLESSNPEKR
ncbi:prolyl endopeptidase FAP-like [Diaphorina citri]|uniref:Prolyl endopeptidase FAP-like n=1 Tax=Diaphorina citri TaxID=121845 RepID=A0A3Q0JH46_DIACI|nr:prolyl endopeptidase FAP-like [Diaphorina citri]